MDLSYISDRAYRLYLLLAYTRDEMFRVRKKELASHTVLPAQSSILMAISRLGDKATPTTISHLIPRDSQTICGILNRMERQELIKRMKSPDNGKTTIINLTEAGRRASLFAMRHESINHMFDSLSEEEQRLLESCLMKLYDRSLKEHHALHMKNSQASKGGGLRKRGRRIRQPKRDKR